MYFAQKEFAKVVLGRGNNYGCVFTKLTSSKAVKDQNHFEAWYRYKPLLHFLKVFRCLCFTCVPQVKQDKLD